MANFAGIKSYVSCPDCLGRNRTVVKVALLTVVLFMAQMFSQETGKTNPPVSPEFAKTANAAFVAIRNSMHSSRGATDLAPDATVQAAINNADVAASSPSETSVVQQIKFLAIMRPLALGLYDLSPSKENLAKLDETNNCIAAWRKALQDLSAGPPKECSSSDKK